MAVIKDDEDGKEKKSQRLLADQFSVSKTQIQSIISNKEAIKTAWKENSCNPESKFKKFKQENYEIDVVVWNWFCAARNKNLPVTGPMLQEKAKEAADALGHKITTGSNGWLEKFKLRHNITCKAICGESAAVPRKTAEQWLEQVKTHCIGYADRDNYNCDETGLFYCTLPKKTLCVKKSKCFGGKVSKRRITVFLCVNMVGEFEKPIVIGKSRTPHCFRGQNIQDLKMTWKFNNTAWMTSEIMTEFLTDFNKKMEKAKRKVVLFLDNAACHVHLEMSNVKLIFLPPNTSSVCQPLDLGIIKTFKDFYKKKLLRHVVSKMDQNESIEKSTKIIYAIHWIISSIAEIKDRTVKKCFKKAGFQMSFEDNEALANCEDNSDQNLQEIQDLIQRICPEMSVEEFMSLDENIET